MGYQTALGIAETNTTIEQQVSWHFSGNCYPPVPQMMVPVAVQAIDLVIGDEADALVELPEGVSFRGNTEVTAYNIVDNLHLWAFVDASFEEDE